MKTQLQIMALMAVTVSLAGSTVARPSAANASDTEGTQVISVTAKKYEFDPSPIHVKQGSQVQLKITAKDHAHGFKISEVPDSAPSNGKPGLVFSSPQDCTKIEEGQTATVEFTAQTPGTYSFRCCVHCGWHHRGMKGELIVDP